MHMFELTTLKEIERADNLSAEEFHREYFLKNKPVILTNSGNDWPCMQKWNMEYFKSKLQLARVQQPSQDGRFHFHEFKKIPFNEFEESLTTTKDKYLSATPILGEKGVVDMKSSLDPIAEDVPVPQFFTKDEIVAANLWVGPGGNKTVLHYDAWHSLLCVVDGTKKFAVYPQKETHKMYPYFVLNLKSMFQGRTMDSPVNPSDIQVDKYPKVKDAHGFKGELQPGEMLFIPAGAWHFVDSYGINVAINYFWDANWKCFLHRPLSDWALKRLIMTPKRMVNKLRAMLKSKRPESTVYD